MFLVDLKMFLQKYVLFIVLQIFIDVVFDKDFCTQIVCCYDGENIS